MMRAIGRLFGWLWSGLDALRKVLHLIVLLVLFGTLWGVLSRPIPIVPGNAALGQELATIVRPLLRASDQTSVDAGFLDRLQANAQKLVRVRPVDEEPRGDDRSAILSRVDQRASQGNVAAAMDELNKLPADARAPMQAWIAKAEARNKAIDASWRLAADAVAALKAAP